MPQLTPEGQQIVDGVAYRHGFSSAAVAEMLGAVAIGHGNQAQFNHYEFGGMGQWSAGGMVMIGDMFNNGLKAREFAVPRACRADPGPAAVRHAELKPVAIAGRRLAKSRRRLRPAARAPAA